jgi:UDP-4-amino-4,6-dideoxy-N-acetyl-beta-L-altrosamine transaminase
VTDRLAIEGGTVVRPSMLPYGRQTVDEEDVARVIETLRSYWLTTGPKVAEFERAFARTVGSQDAVSVSSGTAALHAAAFAAGIEPGDEVITTPITFAATANCVRYLGGTVVFADVDPVSLNLAPKEVKAKISDRTKAIIAVDYGGQPADLDELLAIAANHELIVIEDAAHALGATYKGRPVGSISPLSTFSFHPVKQITTGEGGMVTTGDPAFAERLRSFRNHGISADFRQRERQSSWYYEMQDLGYNYRLTDIQCALGLSQLSKLDGWVSRRREIARRYTEAFESLSEIEVPRVAEDRESSWHLYVIRLLLDRLRVERDQIFRALRAENIGVNVHYIPVPWHPYYQRLGYKKGEWPVAESAYERLISLPLWAGMADEDIRDVIEAVRKVIDAYRK